MLHGHSPFKPHKPLFYDKDVINNIKFQKSIIFNNQLSKECIELINHLVDKNIKKRYNTEDIFYSKFVKNFEKLNYFFPPKNLSEENEENNLNDNAILKTKTMENFYPKSLEDSRQKELIEEYSFELNSSIDEKDIERERKKDYNTTINSPKKIFGKNNLNKKEEPENNFIYFSSNKDELTLINNNSNITQKQLRKLNNIKSFSKQKNKNINNENKYLKKNNEQKILNEHLSELKI